MDFTRDFLERFLDNYFGCKAEAIFLDYEEGYSGDHYILLSDKTSSNEFTTLPTTSEKIRDTKSYDFEFEGHRYNVFFGRYKIAFEFEDFDNVIKIPINGSYDYISGYNDGEFVDVDYWHYRDDYYRKNGIEVENQYHKIDKGDLANRLTEKYFLKSEYLFRWGDFSIYQQKKAVSLFDKYTDEELNELYEARYSKDIRDKVDELAEMWNNDWDTYCMLPKVFIAEIIKREPELSELSAEDVGCLFDTTELHTGFLPDMTPVCFGYCDYDYYRDNYWDNYREIQE